MDETADDLAKRLGITDRRTSIFRALPGYPWLPCPACALEGYPNEIEGCSHTVLERARVAHPGLVIPDQGTKQ